MEYDGIHTEYVESMQNMWIPCGICGFHGRNCGGFHLDSREIFHGVSIWNEHGKLHQNGWALSQKNSIWNPWNPHGISIDSTWNPPGMWGHSKDLYPLAASEQKELDAFLKENLNSGWIQPSKSPMAALIRMSSTYPLKTCI